MPWRQHSGTEETSTNCTDCTFSWGKDTILYCMYSMARQHSGTICINCTVSSQWIRKQTNVASRNNSSQTMLEEVYDRFMTCNVFLASNSEVSLELQCFTAELITYIVCECDAPEWQRTTTRLLGDHCRHSLSEVARQCEADMSGKSVPHQEETGELETPRPRLPRLYIYSLESNQAARWHHIMLT